MHKVTAQVKRLRGTVRADRDRPRLEVRTGIIRAPAGTAPEVRKVFQGLVRQLEPAGILRPADIPLLIQLATALVFERQAAAQLLTEGCTRADDRGRMAKNPAWQIWREAAQTVKSLSAEFGLSPAAREKISAPSGPGMVDVATNPRAWIDAARADLEGRGYEKRVPRRGNDDPD